ncbi:MAG: Gfo/Idh/MocA family oxidoreductase [Longimicrobiales bacterium]|jgi:predicted dehydrogenase|nr:Gfo/Idh/MocA family oxidoreductase [Longimicrobiales bacterium]
MKAIIAGLGSIGMRHARNLRSLGVQDLIGFDPTAERRSRFVEEFGTTAVSGFAEGLKSAPDLAVIASPNRFHVEQAMLCAEAGCHLFVEKPLGTTLKGIDGLKRVVSEKGLFAHVGSNFKFHPALLKMQELIQSGALGRITGAQILAGQWLPGWHPWEDYRKVYSARSDLGGGIVFDTHEFDYLTWLLGPAEQISGFTTNSGALEIDTEDVAAACLVFSSGVIATIQVDYIQRAYRRRYHISGDSGTIEWDFAKGLLDFYSIESDETVTFDVSEEVNEMYLRQMEHVLEGTRTDIAPMTSLDQAAHVLDLQIRLRKNRV